MLYDGIILLGMLILAAAVALPFGAADKVAFHDFWFTFWLMSVCFIYLGACWRYGGMTVGMRAWHVRLVCNGEPGISWPVCFLRFLASLVSLAIFGLGILWALVDNQNRGWHDLVAHTVLIKIEK